MAFQEAAAASGAEGDWKGGGGGRWSEERGLCEKRMGRVFLWKLGLERGQIVVDDRLTCFKADSNSARAPILSPAAYLARPCATRSAALEGGDGEGEGEADDAKTERVVVVVGRDLFDNDIARPRGGPRCRLSASRGRGGIAVQEEEMEEHCARIGAGIAAAATWRGRSSCEEGSMARETG